MTNRLSKAIETSANIAIIMVSVLLCVTLIKNEFNSSPQPAASGPPKANTSIRQGDKLTLPEVDWQKNGQTLLLALSTTCHYCTESAAFYRRLKQDGGDIHLLAVFPQAAEEGEAYLKKLAVPVDEVRQVPFESLNVSGTPTVLLVDGSGEVKASWVGKLPSNQETEVITRLKQK